MATAERAPHIAPEGPRATPSGSEEEHHANDAADRGLEQMHQMVNGRGVKGDDLAAAAGARRGPATFTLRGHARRNRDGLGQDAKEATKPGSHYGTLRLRVSYATGRRGGVREALICAQSKQVPATPVACARVLDHLRDGTWFRGTSRRRRTRMAEMPTAGRQECWPAGGVPCRRRQAVPHEQEQYGQRGALLPFDVRSSRACWTCRMIAAGRLLLTSILSYPGGPRMEFNDRSPSR